jgi:hypothetical protein
MHHGNYINISLGYNTLETIFEWQGTSYIQNTLTQSQLAEPLVIKQHMPEYKARVS